jgi:LysR family hydrogen peroxide-inducible transcriptional activator
MPDALLRNLDEGRLDVLLFPLPIRAADLVTVRLFREPLWIVVPGDHELARKQSAARSDLKNETVLTLERGHRLHDQARDLCEQFGANLSLDYEGTSLDTLRQMVGLGMGISFMPALYIKAEVLQDDQIVARQLEPRSPFRMIGMIWRRHSARQEEFVALAELIRSNLKTGVPEVTVID